MRRFIIMLVIGIVLFVGGIAATVAKAGGPPVDEYGCTPSETYSGPFSAQLGVTGCVGNGTSVTFCHATSSETNPFVTLTTAIAAAVGQAGHFYENGTTQAGHEEDYVGPCVEVPPVDVCPDDEGIQTSEDECTVEPPPVDVCPDLEGVQTSTDDCPVVPPVEPPVEPPVTPPTTPPVKTPPTVVPDTPVVGVPSTPADTL